MNVHAYSLERMGRVVNNSTNKINVEYQICEVSYFYGTKNTEKKCVNKQIELKPGEYFEEDLQTWYLHTKVTNELYAIVRDLLVNKVSDGQYATRFRQGIDDEDNDPKAPLSSYCHLTDLGTARVIKQLSTHQYYCGA